MRYIMTTVVLFAFCFTTVPAQAEDHTTTGQVLLAFGRTVGDAELGNSKVGFYAHGTALMDFGAGNFLLFGYFGPKFSMNKTTVWLLGGPFLSVDGGTSLLASIWLEQKVFIDQLVWFLEGDAYFPIPTSGGGEHTGRQYYILSSLYYHWEKIGVGLVTEHFLSEDDVFEAAVGPGMKIGSIEWWLGYDFTPATKKDNMFLIRLSVSL